MPDYGAFKMWEILIIYLFLHFLLFVECITNNMLNILISGLLFLNILSIKFEYLNLM